MFNHSSHQGNANQNHDTNAYPLDGCCKGGKKASTVGEGAGETAQS